jgi:hypothetical protein
MLSIDTRPRVFAGVQLLLDACQIARTVVDLDLESVIIYYCVAEATMSPLMLGPHVPDQARRAVKPPEEFRGSITRLLISERTQLSRETVRRKANALVEAGLLVKDSRGRVSTPRNLDNPRVRQAANDLFTAVERYDARLRQFGARSLTS